MLLHLFFMKQQGNNEGKWACLHESFFRGPRRQEKTSTKGLAMTDHYENCKLCPRECGVNRYKYKGYCGCKAELRAARSGLHFYEEPFLSGSRGSGTVFFSGCSLGCIYCQNFKISEENLGFDISTDRLTEIFLEQQRRGAHNINLVTASHFTPTVVSALEKAKCSGLSIPVIWNSSGYEKAETLSMLKGLVDIFMPDLKTLSCENAARYMKAPDYPEIVKEAVKCMHNMTDANLFLTKDNKIVSKCDGEDVLMLKGLVVRHLVIPGQIEDSKAVIKYLYESYGDSIWISLMSQYTPVGRWAAEADSEDKIKYPELYRKLSEEEYDELIDYAIDLGVENCMIQDGDVAMESFIPDFDGSGL